MKIVYDRVLTDKLIINPGWSFQYRPSLSPWWWHKPMGTIDAVNLSSYLIDGDWK